MRLKYGKTTMYMNIQLHDIFSFFFEMKSVKNIKLTNVNNKMVIFLRLPLLMGGALQTPIVFYQIEFMVVCTMHSCTLHCLPGHCSICK